MYCYSPTLLILISSPVAGGGSGMWHVCGVNLVLVHSSLPYRFCWQIVIFRYHLTLGITLGIILGIIVVANGILGYQQYYLYPPRNHHSSGAGSLAL